MSVKITLADGTKIEGDSGKEVAIAARELRKSLTPEQPKVPVRKTNGGNPLDLFTRATLGLGPDTGYDVRIATVELLEAIHAAGNHGLPAQKVQKIVHADTPKGIGGRMVKINGHLRRLGFMNTETLFDNPKDRKTGTRVWKPKADLVAAIDAARKAATEN